MSVKVVFSQICVSNVTLAGKTSYAIFFYQGKIVLKYFFCNRLKNLIFMSTLFIFLILLLFVNYMTTSSFT